MVNGLYRSGVTANQVTVLACLVSMGLGLGLWFLPVTWTWFALIPLWMLLRMAFNAVDGMLAREHGQQSVLGAYLNELTDVLSDASLYWPFVKVWPEASFWVVAVMILAAMSEMAGVLGWAQGASRRYDGPMGKSDRAFVFGALGLAVAVCASVGAGPRILPWLSWSLPVVAALTSWSIYNRVQSGIQDIHERRSANQH